MFGTGRRFEAVLAALRAENTDLRTQLRLERSDFAEREKVLFDRILALTNPGALRSVVRATAETPTPESREQEKSSGIRRIHYPGYSPHTRPPSHPRSPVTPGPKPPAEEDAS